MSAHSDTGYACSLSALSDAQLIDGRLGRGEKTGYRFEIRNCAPDTEGGANGKYQVVAYPMVKNQTGVRAFCTDESAAIKVDPSGSPQKCLNAGALLE